MHSWKTALITLAIFALGGMAGSLITAQVIKGKIERVEVTRPTPDIYEGPWPAMMVRAMEKQVQLTPEQSAKVRDIMRHTQQEVIRLRTEWQQNTARHEDPGSPEPLRLRDRWRLETRRTVMRSDEQIAALLTSEQVPRFEEFKRQRIKLQFNRGQNGPNAPNGQPRPQLLP